MTSPIAWARQHLIDPEECAHCGGCEEVCPREAISHNRRAYVVDFERCDNCGKCSERCQTGAVNSWRYVPRERPYTVAEQLAWDTLPEQDARCVAEELEVKDEPPATSAVATHLYNAKNPLLAKVVVNRVAAYGPGNEVHHIVLETEPGRLPIVEGQSIGVLTPGLDAYGEEHHMRLYSLASARDGEAPGTSRWALTVKRVVESREGLKIPGVCSNYLCSLAPGSEVRLVGPFGDSFVMPDDDVPLIMIATGVGIAPMRGMIQRLQRTGRASKDHVLFYGGRTRAELSYVDDFEMLANSSGIDLHLAFSREPDQPRRYVQDLICEQASKVRELLTEHNAQIFVCGMLALQADFMTILDRILDTPDRDGVLTADVLASRKRLHVEVF